MNKNLMKVVLGAAVAASVTAASMPSRAIMVGVAGEALLVPLVVWGGSGTTADPNVNTIIRVTIPDTFGFDSLPNIFTAPHTTPTWSSAALFPPDPDRNWPGKSSILTSAIHWYWFDQYSVHRLNRGVPVTANDVVEINWRDVAGRAWANQRGYMVIGTEAARTGAPANFAMFGDAWLVFSNRVESEDSDTRARAAMVPVLPMSDGADGPFNSPVTVDDNVKYANGIPRQVSPLISGMRTNRSDGERDDTTVFDLTLGKRYDGLTISVVWLDVNQGSPASNPTGPTVNDEGGLVTYNLPEYIDNNVDAPESAGVAFSLILGSDVLYTPPNTLWGGTTLGHERGTFK
jgi:hypothetical protein